MCNRREHIHVTMRRLLFPDTGIYLYFAHFLNTSLACSHRRITKDKSMALQSATVAV